MVSYFYDKLQEWKIKCDTMLLDDGQEGHLGSKYIKCKEQMKL